MIEQIFWKLYFIFYYFLIMIYGVWNLISLTGIEPVFPALEVWRLNYWTGREVPRK